MQTSYADLAFKADKDYRPCYENLTTQEVEAMVKEYWRVRWHTGLAPIPLDVCYEDFCDYWAGTVS